MAAGVVGSAAADRPGRARRRPPRPPPATPGLPRTPPRSPSPPPTTRPGPIAAAVTTIGVFEKLAGDLGAVLRRPAAPLRLRQPRDRDDLARHLHRRPAPLGAAHGVGRAERQDRRTWPRSAWAGASTADFTDVDAAALADVAARRLDWGARRVTLPAGRYETLLPPSAVADLMIYLAWSMDGRPAQEGRSALAGPDGRGSASGSPPCRSPWPATRPRPGWSTRRSSPPLRSGEGVSVFDNGAPTRRVEWVRDGVVDELAYSRAEAAEFGTAFAPARRQPAAHRGCGRRRSPTWSPARERGLLLTCLWYIRAGRPRRRCCSPASRATASTWWRTARWSPRSTTTSGSTTPRWTSLRRRREVGATERTLPREWKDWFTRVAMPPMRVPEFFMSSVSLGR